MYMEYSYSYSDCCVLSEMKTAIKHIIKDGILCLQVPWWSSLLLLSDNIDSPILAIKISLSRYNNYSLLTRYCCKIARNIVTKFI